MPTSIEDAMSIAAETRATTQSEDVRTASAVLVDAEHWIVEPDAASVSADVSELIAQYGNGVYAVAVYAILEDDLVPVSRYSIFVDDAAEP